ncbi:MAG: CheR family methyltransferase [Candidatus Binatia bacterium]
MRSNSRPAHAQGDLLKLRDLLEEKTGLYLPVEKLDRLEEPFRDPKGSLASTRLEQVIQAIAACSVEGRTYLNKLVAAVATKETYFFRTSSHFEVLKSYLLSELSQAKVSQGKKTLRIWSAGCATGEEPYSLAILLLDTLPDIHAWEVTILATDIDLDALERAQEGIYRPWSFRGVEPETIKKYFHRERGDCYRVDDQIRSWITFQPLNLKSDPYPSLLNGTSDLDIILCRNVTIYFRPETTQEVVRRFYACLNEGGFLLAGAVEYSPHAYQDFEARVFPETVVYQKHISPKHPPSPKPVPPLLPLSFVRQPPPASHTPHKGQTGCSKKMERQIRWMKPSSLSLKERWTRPWFLSLTKQQKTRRIAVSVSSWARSLPIVTIYARPPTGFPGLSLWIRFICGPITS